MTTETWILFGLTMGLTIAGWIFIFAPDFIKNWKEVMKK